MNQQRLSNQAWLDLELEFGAGAYGLGAVGILSGVCLPE